MIARADPRRVLAVMDARMLAFSDNAFDVIVSTFVIDHFPDPVAAMQEARRVLAGGGWIGVVEWGRRLFCGRRSAYRRAG